MQEWVNDMLAIHSKNVRVAIKKGTFDRSTQEFEIQITDIKRHLERVNLEVKAVENILTLWGDME